MNRRSLLALLPRALGAALLSRMGLSSSVRAQAPRRHTIDTETLYRALVAASPRHTVTILKNGAVRVHWSAEEEERLMLASVFGPPRGWEGR